MDAFPGMAHALLLQVCWPFEAAETLHCTVESHGSILHFSDTTQGRAVEIFGDVLIQLILCYHGDTPHSC